MNTVQIDENEKVDYKQLFITIFHYKYMILLFTVTAALISTYHAYFKPDIYRASATVEVGVESYGNRGGDVISQAMSPGSLDAETEKGIIRSRFLATKAADKVDVLHRYYATRKFKEVELYKSSPFNVGMLRGYGISFELYPVDEKHYRLVMEGHRGKKGEKWIYDKVLPYGEEIDTPDFHLNIVKTGEMKDEKYRFVILNPKDRGVIAKGGVSVSQVSKFSHLLQISYEDTVPLRAQEFANALANAYLQQNIEKKTKEATQKLEFPQ